MTINFDEALMTGGSERGIHYYITGAACPRKLAIQEAAKAAREEGQFHPALRRDAGTCFHLLAELYHMGQLPNGWQENYTCELNPDAAVEGIRLFEFYQDITPVYQWGIPIDTEVPLDSRNADADLGVLLTGSIDLVTRVTPAHAEELMSLTGTLVEPGLHLLDWKTMGQKRSTMHTEFGFSLQFRSYAHLWNTTKGRDPADMVKGIIVPVIVSHKKLTANSFVALYVDPPNEEQVTELRQFLAAADRHIKTNFANLSQCFSPGAPIYGPCPFIGTECDWENK
jgi:hypothetical protein